MTLAERYQALLAGEGLHEDPAQLRAIDALQRVVDELAVPAPHGWRRWLRPPAPPVRGLYLWGGVGRGKTWLVDLFYQCLPFPEKTRRHFHRFMADVHQSLKSYRNQADPQAYQQLSAEEAR